MQTRMRMQILGVRRKTSNASASCVQKKDRTSQGGKRQGATVPSALTRNKHVLDATG